MISIPNQANYSEQLNNVAAEIGLPPEHPVTRGAREGVMIVLQAFSECEHGDQIVVRAVIIEVKAARSEVVADRSHAPARLIDDETPNQATPQETERSARPRARQDSPENSGKNKTQSDPIKVGAMYPEQRSIAHQVSRKAP